jgi:hypothetical protein
MTPYNEPQLMEALASLALTNEHESTHTINDDCSHIYGFNKSSKPGPFFKSKHELSMLQKITARRVLDYLEQRVSYHSLSFFYFSFFVFKFEKGSHCIQFVLIIVAIFLQ